jgi:hypothetical protein
MPLLSTVYHRICKSDSFTFLKAKPPEKNTIPHDTHNNVEQFYEKDGGEFCT